MLLRRTAITLGLIPTAISCPIARLPDCPIALWLDKTAQTFLHQSMEFREEPCKTALNRVEGMPFKWSLNPYMGCAHRCAFCYVRAFERRADRPSDDRYGQSLRVK